MHAKVDGDVDQRIQRKQYQPISQNTPESHVQARMLNSANSEPSRWRLRTMADNLNPEQRRRAMQAVRSRNTKPEIQLRKSLHALGFRFRIHRRDLPGSPDIVFPKHRAVVFVHGCFWHGHAGCRRAVLPATRTDYWRDKRERNRRRDAAATRKLRCMGWRVKVVWTCQLDDPRRVAETVSRWIMRR